MNMPKVHFLLFCVASFVISSTTKAQWVQTGGPYNGSISSIAISGRNILSATEGAGVFLSNDEGASWTPSVSGLSNLSLTCLAASGNTVVAGAAEFGAGIDSGWIFISTNNGMSWTQTHYHDAYSSINAASGIISLAVSGDTIVAGTDSRGAFWSLDNGASWDNMYYGPFNSLVGDYISAVLIKGSSVFLAVYGYGMSRSLNLVPNTGYTWTQLPTDYQTTGWIHALKLVGSNIFAGTEGTGIYLSTDNGDAWLDKGLTNRYVNAIASNGNFIYSGTDSGVFLSADSGTHWNAINTGLSNANINALAVDDSFLFAGTAGGVLWRRALSQLTFVTSQVSNVPSGFSLGQNFPNPFNPTTIIDYQLPASSFVTLKIYDILGREVVTLINAKQNAGYYSATFNAANIPSGVYFYRLQAGKYSNTKKLLLLK